VPTNYQILKFMRAVLEPAGFRLSGTTFHRVNEARFIEVVNLQGGVRSLAGKSAVNLGIFIPEVWVLLGKAESLEHARAKMTPKEYDCAIVERLSRLVYERDQWFERNDPNIGQIISGLISNFALPWFAELGSFSALTEALTANRFRRQVAWGTQAAILKAAGEVSAVRSFLQQLQDVDPVRVDAYAASIGIEL
jgi:hypothetical protein